MYCVLPENPKEISQKLEWSGFSAAETYGTCTGPRSGEEPRNDLLQPPPRLLQNQYTQPTGDNLIFGHPFQREGSLTGPLFVCHAYPPQHPCRPFSTAGGPFGYYLLPVPVTLPQTMHLHEAKQECDAMSPFNMGYPEIDHTSHRYANSHVSTIFALSLSYEHSTTCSESGYQYPTTPSQT
jgi:hypothetical protein